ncbi:hypothetical protein [Candidatus Pantoea formicae]
MMSVMRVNKKDRIAFEGESNKSAEAEKHCPLGKAEFIDGCWQPLFSSRD